MKAQFSAQGAMCWKMKAESGHENTLQTALDDIPEPRLCGQQEN